MKSLIEALQLSEISDLLAETITDLSTIARLSTTSADFTSNTYLKLESAELSDLGNNFNDNFRIGSSNVTDLGIEPRCL